MKTQLVRLLVAAIAATLLAAAPARAGLVGLELLLLVDVSGSIDDMEYQLQKQGYVAAFLDPFIQGLIADTPGGVAVAYAEWSGAFQQQLLVPWTLLTDGTSAGAFAAALAGTSRSFHLSPTATGDALLYGAPLFTDNGFEGARLVIDISGDGEQNHAPSMGQWFDYSYTASASAAAQAAGITVNGLAIGQGQLGNLPHWYETYITGPGGGTLYAVADFDDFEDAVAVKIGEEISGGGGDPVPEPATLVLLGVGLVALALRRPGRRG